MEVFHRPFWLKKWHLLFHLVSSTEGAETNSYFTISVHLLSYLWEHHPRDLNIWDLMFDIVNIYTFKFCCFKYVIHPEPNNNINNNNGNVAWKAFQITVLIKIKDEWTWGVKFQVFKDMKNILSGKFAFLIINVIGKAWSQMYIRSSLLLLLYLGFHSSFLPAAWG